MATAGRDLEPAILLPQALVQAAQAVARLDLVATAAIVADLQDDVRAFPARTQPQAAGPGVAHHVGDRLLRATQQDVRTLRVVHREWLLDVHLDGELRHVLGQGTECGAEALATRAYENTALPIGHGQTISQPWVVARMTEVLLQQGMPKRVLEIGTGSGYQAAVLAALGIEVYTVERIGDLLRTARKRFRTLGLQVRSKHDDGRIGWPEEAPFDGVIVTAAAASLVDALSAQLAPGGTLVAPVGGSSAQSLLRLRKTVDGDIEQDDLGPVVFVPLLSGMTDQ